MQSNDYPVDSEDAMMALGASLASGLSKPAVITLSGDLGAGKSVLARGIIRALGHGGAVKSPTYTLIEQYETDQWRIAHLDLYRLEDGEELHYLGFDDIVANSDLLLIEWPDKAAGLLPKSTVDVRISYSDSGRLVSVDQLA